MSLISIEGERWDTLCLRAYGSITQEGVDALRLNNPAAARASTNSVLPAGFTITVPEMATTQLSTVDIAPWQR